VLEEARRARGIHACPHLFLNYFDFFLLLKFIYIYIFFYYFFLCVFRLNFYFSIKYS
jgi:hypothetical protein